MTEVAHGKVSETAKRRRLRLLGDALASGGLSLIFPRRPSDPLRTAITDEEHAVLLNALEDYAEWAGDAEEDKRAQYREYPSDEGLQREADHLANDRAVAQGLLARLIQ